MSLVDLTLASVDLARGASDLVTGRYSAGTNQFSNPYDNAVNGDVGTPTTNTATNATNTGNFSGGFDWRSNLNWNGVNITDGAVNNTTDATNTTGDATRTDGQVDASKWDPRGDSSSNPTNWWQNYDWGGFYDTGNNVGSGDTTAGSDGTVGSDGTQTGKGDDVVKDEVVEDEGKTDEEKAGLLAGLGLTRAEIAGLLGIGIDLLTSWLGNDDKGEDANTKALAIFDEAYADISGKADQFSKDNNPFLETLYGEDREHTQNPFGDAAEENLGYLDNPTSVTQGKDSPFGHLGQYWADAAEAANARSGNAVGSVTGMDQYAKLQAAHTAPAINQYLGNLIQGSGQHDATGANILNTQADLLGNRATATGAVGQSKNASSSAISSILGKTATWAIDKWVLKNP